MSKSMFLLVLPLALLMLAGTVAAIPTINSLALSPSSGTAKIGDVITLTISADATGYAAGAITVNGVAATGFTDNSDNTYTVTYTVAPGDTDQAAGSVPASVTLVDPSDSSTATSSTIDANTLAIDANAPALLSVTIASNNANPALAKTGDQIVLLFTADEAIAPVVTIDGQPAAMTDLGGNNYQATYIMAGTEAEGAVTFTIDYPDLAGNAGTQATSTTDASSVTFDMTAPTISANEGTDAGPVQSDTINVNADGTTNEYGFSPDSICDASDTYGNPFASGADFAIAGDHTDYLCVQSADDAGNSAYLLVGQLNTDNTAPFVSSVDSDGQTYNLATASPQTIKVTFSEDIASAPSIDVDDSAQIVNDCGDVDAKTFCFDYAIPADTQSILTITISSAQDAAGNTMGPDSTHTFEVDTRTPVVGPISIVPSATIDGTLYVSGTSDISATVTDDGSGIWSCEYTLDDGETWTEAAYSSSETGTGTCTASGVDTFEASYINMRADGNNDYTGYGTAVPVSVDTISPDVWLNSPCSEEDECSAEDSTRPTFEWAAWDSVSSNLSCNLTIDEVLNLQNLSVISDEDFSTEPASNLTAGEHTWSVSCSDEVGNVGSSGTDKFRIRSVLGDEDEIDEEFESGCTVLVNGTEREGEDDYSGTQQMEIDCDGSPEVEFDHDFEHQFDFSNIRIHTGEDEDDDASYIEVNGTNATGGMASLKTVFLYGVNTSFNGVCVLETENATALSISSDCTAANEFRVMCDGSSTPGTSAVCTSPSSGTLKVSGLRYSAVKQYNIPVTAPAPAPAPSSGYSSTGGGSFAPRPSYTPPAPAPATPTAPTPAPAPAPAPAPQPAAPVTGQPAPRPSSNAAVPEAPLLPLPAGVSGTPSAPAAPPNILTGAAIVLVGPQNQAMLASLLAQYGSMIIGVLVVVLLLLASVTLLAKRGARK